MSAQLQTERAAVAELSAPIAAPIGPVVEVRNMELRLGKEFTLLIPDLNLRPGELLAVIGPNGSGKSSLLSCLVGLVRLSFGQVTILGSPAAQLPLATRRKLGVQLQGSGYNDLYLVRDLRRLHELMYGLSDQSIFDAFDVGSLSSKRYGTLSSGEQQRVQLAMALAHRPSLAVFDEPTSNLDPHFEDVFCTLLRQRATQDGEFSCIFVTHSPRVVSLCDQLLVMRRGSIDRFGARDALVEESFGQFACMFSGTALELERIKSLMPQPPSMIGKSGEGDTLVFYGEKHLKEIALATLAAVPVHKFTLWLPDAADLLESIKHG